MGITHSNGGQTGQLFLCLDFCHDLLIQGYSGSLFVFTVPFLILWRFASCGTAAVINAVTAEPLKAPLIGVWSIVPFLSGILLQGGGLIGGEPRGCVINLSCQFLNIEFMLVTLLV